MKNRMPKRKILNKISTYLRNNHGSFSTTTRKRAEKRFFEGRTKSVPSSTKLGTGVAYAYRTNKYGNKKLREKVEEKLHEDLKTK